MKKIWKSNYRQRQDLQEAKDRSRGALKTTTTLFSARTSHIKILAAYSPGQAIYDEDENYDGESSSPESSNLLSTSVKSIRGQSHPFQRSLQVLERLTEVISQSRAEAPGAPEDSSTRTHGTPGETIDENGPLHHPDAEVEGGVSGKCRVSLNMVRLLTGFDGNDAMGRPVGMTPGQDVETEVIEGCFSVSERCRFILSISDNSPMVRDPHTGYPLVPDQQRFNGKGEIDKVSPSVYEIIDV